MVDKKNTKTTKKVNENKTHKNKIEVNAHLNKLNIWMISSVILQIFLVILILMILTGHNNIKNYDNQINNIENKVSAIDNFFKSNIDGYNSDGNSAQTAPAKKVEVSADDDPFLGNENAKVTVIEFSDLQCPFCRKYWTETYPQIKKDFIDTGKIKYVFRDFPLNFHPSAPIAAVAANCVREQFGDEGYFKFHDIAFTEQNKQGQNTIRFTQEDIFNWVDMIGGIDKDKFNICFNDPAQKQEVENDLKDGAAAGVSGTPSFFINGKLLVGAQPYSVIKVEIEKALSEAN